MRTLKVLMFGATGMVGRGVLREALAAPEVEGVLSVTRRVTDTPPHPKLQELVHKDFNDFSHVATELQGFDACFWCLGVSSAGMSEPEYTKITHDYTMAAAKVMVNPGMTFVFVSGQGADASEKGSVMWARVKGKTENELLAMPFKDAYVFRPGIIQAMHGIESATKMYRIMYKVMSPLLPVIKHLAPDQVTSTEAVGWAMLQCALAGAPDKFNKNKEINALAKGYASRKVM